MPTRRSASCTSSLPGCPLVPSQNRVPSKKQRVVVVLGPTATGKSSLGIALAQQLGGEVINADSMQLYKGMDVGTAKLSHDERQGVVHHLLDIWPVTATASVADYQQRARRAIDEVARERARRRSSWAGRACTSGPCSTR